MSPSTTINPTATNRSAIARRAAVRTVRKDTPSAVALRPGFWRIVHPAGPVLGYIELEPVAGGERYRARRLVAATTRVVEIGEFWSFDDAVECFAA